MPTLRQTWDETAAALAAAGIDQARSEASWLLEHVLKTDRTRLLCRLEEALPADAAKELDARRRRRVAGEPLQYILGTAPFCDFELETGPGVLIPRPETETLVELAQAAYGATGGAGPVLDLCTGSGAVALALARSLPPETPVYATDLSAAALTWARRNRARLGLEKRTILLEGDLFAPLPPGLRFRVITANPPYIPAAEYAALPPEVREFEPKLALEAGADGLDVLRRIAEAAPARLLSGGWLLCEIDSPQAAAVTALFQENGLEEAAVHPDRFGRARIATARKPASPTPAK